MNCMEPSEIVGIFVGALRQIIYHTSPYLNPPLNLKAQ